MRFGTDARIRLARWYGRRHNLKGAAGGWIYRCDANGQLIGRAIVQGWLALYYREYQAIWYELNGEQLP